jgi:predicted sulfurtransferase
MVVLASAMLSIGGACQKAQLADYHKFQNDSEVPRISIEDAKKGYDDGTVVMIDARAEVAYKQEHISGALNMQKEDKYAELPKDKRIIVYCS